jgi:sulfonate transport system substrate-binding protein
MPASPPARRGYSRVPPGGPARPGRALRLAAILALLALIAAGCGAPRAARPPSRPVPGRALRASHPSRVTLHIGDQAGAATQALLAASGLARRLPFRVTWARFGSGAGLVQAIAAGAVDIGSVSSAPPVFAAAGGDDVAVVGAAAARPRGMALLVRAGSAIRRVAQLRGRRIAVARGSPADYHLLTVLRKAGLAAGDVTVDYLSPAAGRAALAAGRVAAWDTGSPFAELAELDDHARDLASGPAYGSPYSFTLAGRGALAEPAKAAAIRGYLRLLGQAYAWAARHPAAWAAVWARSAHLPPTVTTRAAADDVAVAVPLTQAVISSEQQVSNAFTAAGLIPGHVDVAGLVDSGFSAGAAGRPWRPSLTAGWRQRQ